MIPFELLSCVEPVYEKCMATFAGRRMREQVKDLETACFGKVRCIRMSG